MVVACPLDKILQLASSSKESRIEDAIDEIFFFAIDMNGRGRWYLLTWEGVVGGMFEKGDMEDRMDLHRVWKVQAYGVGGLEVRILKDLEGSQATMVQFS
jgi:hypothetical protein